MSESGFQRLQLLPLFQGSSREELLRMLERAKFNFISVEPQEIILHQGAAATQLIYVLNGKIQSQRTFSADLEVSEYREGPHLFQPENLFGASPLWRHTLTAVTDVQLLMISKQDLMVHLMDFWTFRMAFMNYLCRLTETNQSKLAPRSSITLQSAFIDYVQQLVITPSGHKELKIGMKQLALQLSTSRLSMSKCLNHLQQLGVLKLGRKSIVIPDNNRLIDLARLND